jgi:hypothetical protein
VLRIDETSGTLVAPQASGLVQESPPDREELLALVTSSWEAFAGELGLPGVKLLAREPVPYVDLLGYDDESHRLVVILVTGDTVEWQLGRALGAAAEVSGWDKQKLEEAHESLADVEPGESPALVLVAGGYDERALATIEWLSGKHGVPISAYTVAMVRFGGERLLSVRREPAENGGDPASDVQWLLSGGVPAGAAGASPSLHSTAASTPPPA